MSNILSFPVSVMHMQFINATNKPKSHKPKHRRMTQIQTVSKCEETNNTKFILNLEL